ncbi:MAG: histidine kinase dimerization/phospho-acceptor domain-containing protein, partial [Acidobacteriota bacterium]
MKFWHRWRLATMMTIVFSTLLVAVVATVSVLSIQADRKAFRSELEQQAALMVGSLAVTAADDLYQPRVDRLKETAIQLSGVDQVAEARFYDRDGRLLADSTYPGGVRSLEIDPVGRRLLDNEGFTFEWRTGQLLAGQAVVVSGQRFGAVTIALSTEAFENKMVAASRQALLLGLLAALVGAFVAHRVSRSVVEPLRELAVSTRHVAVDDLDQQVDPRGSRELVELGVAYNAMATRLRAARLELVRANSVLELRVEERTAALRQEIAEREQAEAELREAKHAAEQAAEAKSLFLANMSHEIRTPLHAVIGIAELLEYEPLNEQQHGHVQRIRASGSTLLRLVEDILDLSKIESQTIELAEAPFHLGEVIDTSLEQVALAATDKNLELGATVSPECPRRVVGDAGRLEQVLVNLLGNAIKFTAAGEVSLTVTAEPLLT